MNKFLQIWFIGTIFFIVSCSKDSEPQITPDTSGPELSFNIVGVEADETGILNLSGQIEININAQDNRGVSKVEAFIDSEKLGEDTNAPFNIIIDLSSITSKQLLINEQKEHVLKITATDSAGNETSEELIINIEDKTRLLTLNFEEGLITTAVSKTIVFISDMNGILLDSKEVKPETEQVVFYMPEGFGTQSEYMLSIDIITTTDFHALSTVQNLSLELLNKINFTKPELFYGGDSRTYSVTGFDPQDILSGDAWDYVVGHVWGTEEFDIHETLSFENDVRSDKTYVYSFNPSNMAYSYQFLTNPISNDHIFDKADFLTEGLEAKSFSYIGANPMEPGNVGLIINGYESTEAFNNNHFYKLFDFGTTINAQPKFDYTFNTGFDKYRHKVFIKNYYSERVGAPLEQYEVPNWSMDYTMNENTIDFTVDGSGFSLGRIKLSETANANPDYTWNIMFNVTKTTSVTIPQLPESLSGTSIRTRYENKDFTVGWTELVSYDTLTSFDDYIVNIIKEGAEVKKVTNVMDLIYKSESGAFYPTEDFLFH